MSGVAASPRAGHAPPLRRTIAGRGAGHDRPETELVTVTVDDREIQVPKGTGMVETALAAGIEIPVFCYEPRLGPPVGACRMCLCEVEGMPKLQAACTLTAQDGLALRTAQSSEKAAEGQKAVLEFILLNHPLDCPDCDKGGECPLQDLTFRCGPVEHAHALSQAHVRQADPDLARDLARPRALHPLLPLHALLRVVSEDMQLVALNRGAHSIIATFENEPYRAHFSGNVTELCPVGALLPATYRFRARPWEIDNVPTVCGLCPVGLQRLGADARGEDRAHPLAQPSRDRRRLALRQGPLHVRPPARGRSDHARRSCASGGAASTPSTSRGRSRRRPRGCAQAEGSIVVAFSGGETVEQAGAIARLVRHGLGDAQAILPDDLDPAVDALPRAARRDPRTPRSASSSATSPVVERAPLVDLWLRAARREGRRDR